MKDTSAGATACVTSLISKWRIGLWSTTVLITLSLCCASAVVAVLSSNARPLRTARDATEVNGDLFPSARRPLTNSAAPQAKRVEAEVITIHSTGFLPAAITRPQGLFVLAVENRSGLQVVQLRLDHEAGAGARLRDVQMPRNKHDWKDALDLTPGSYILTEAYHPEWVCKITITSK